jgi:hypothetical protein
MRPWLEFDGVYGACGVGVIFNFGAHKDSLYSTFGTPTDHYGGIGYNIAGFVNTKICKKVYEDIQQHAEIVFQSPVKTNANTGRHFFFIVYKRKE